MNKITLLLCCLMANLCAVAQQYMDTTEKPTYKKVEKSFKFRVSFTDKKDCGYSVKKPEAFLSTKAIERRKRYGLKIDEHDLPLTPAYVKALTNMGLRVHNQSKWNNTIVVQTADSTVMQRVRKLAFVKNARCVWESPDSVMVVTGQPKRESLVTNKRDTTLADYYGYGAKQVRMLGVDHLHKAGFTGKGVTIAVIDGGFFNADLIRGFDHTHILGTRNFVRPEKSVYEELDHGMMVLACIAANEPNYLVGTAPEASFYLLQSEDGETEQLIEEDNWCAAVEYADSLGCDVITSSLGYQQFDHEYMNHHYWEMDGQTALNSCSASLAASRGMLLLNSAGNSGDDTWKKIGFPADACDMLTVGAVTKDKKNAFFSSVGNTSDDRIKPDVMAVGVNSDVYDDDGTIVEVNGTSFSCPTMCGAVACLVQAFPHRRPTEIIKALQQSADNAAHPDNIFGYGIPNVERAARILKTTPLKKG